jgi:small-conductance mechanosensitive channel
LKVKIVPFNYIGQIVEQGLLFHTVRLVSGTLVIAPTSLIETVE